jgi:GTP-binding protein HflX
VPPAQIVSVELAQALCRVARDTGRQVGLFLDRRGQVEQVFVGDAHRLRLPDFGRIRAGRGRFRGLRLVHAHLDDVALTGDDLTDLTLLRLDLVAAVHQVDEDAEVSIEFAHLSPGRPGQAPHERSGPRNLHQLAVDFLGLVGDLEAELGSRASGAVTGQGPRAVLSCVTSSSVLAAEGRLRELRELARSAGVELVAEVHQRRPQPDPKFMVGKGKLEEIVGLAMQRGAELLVFDPDLTPAQARAITAFTDLKVIDRTMLILDIFAQRARSRDGKVQVELAQLRYALPRLVEKNTMMSRLTGWIGGRGPGETKLELNRRRARDRIVLLEREIEALAGRRALTRRERERRALPVVAIVGYTNAGKSTLLNTLTRSQVFTEDKLFATLDPTSRRLRFPEERELILTDTVGFIRELPPDLARAFKATLEELEEADLLLHLVDASEPGLDERIDAVEGILADMGIGEIPRLVVYNKIDRLPDQGAGLGARPGGAFRVSARDPETCRPLLETLARRLWRG